MKKKSIILACAAVGVACAIASGNGKTKEAQKELNEGVVLNAYNSGKGSSDDVVLSSADTTIVQNISQAFGKIVKPGDIWFDRIGAHVKKGPVEFWTGHCGIVKKVEYDYSSHQYKLLVIEANPGDGVQEHYVTVNRFIQQESSILRVRTNDLTRQDAVKFCEGQRYKPYPSYSGIPNFNWKKDPSTSEGKKDIANSNCSWYCSELVWAAYKKNYIDIEGKFWPHGLPENHVDVSPYEIEHSDKTYEIVKYNSKVTVWSHGTNEHGYYFEDGTVNFESHELETSGRYSHCTVCNAEFWQPC